MEEKKNIEVVSGDGSNLEISPVYDHLNVSTPKSAEKKPKYVFQSQEILESQKTMKKCVQLTETPNPKPQTPKSIPTPVVWDFEFC